MQLLNINHHRSLSLVLDTLTGSWSSSRSCSELSISLSEPTIGINSSSSSSSCARNTLLYCTHYIAPLNTTNPGSSRDVAIVLNQYQKTTFLVGKNFAVVYSFCIYYKIYSQMLQVFSRLISRNFITGKFLR